MNTSRNRNQIKSSDLQRQGHTKQVFRTLASKFDFYSSPKTEKITTQIESIQILEKKEENLLKLETEVRGILYNLVEVQRHNLHLPKQNAADADD